jgi:hypothetical protein
MKEWFYKTERDFVTREKVRKFNWDRVAGIFIALFIISFLTFLFIAIPQALRETSEKMQAAAAREAKCMAAGYSEVRIANYGLGQVYCYKLENGTEVLTPIERVE